MSKPTLYGTTPALPPKAFCIFIDSVCEGRVPLVKDAQGKPFLFSTQEEAERDIIDSMMIRLQQCLDGERDFDDAIVVEEYVARVWVLEDGTVREDFQECEGEC